MNDTDFQAARAALREARRSARCLERVEPAWVPPDLARAMDLQRSVAADLGGVRGWKISGLTAEQQRGMGMTTPIAAPLLDPWVRPTGDATFTLRQFVRPRLECEFAFELKTDLPSRRVAYTRPEVEAAIGALRIGVEVVDSRLPIGSPVLMELADDLNNGAYVLGTANPAWQHIRYAAQRISLRWNDGHEDDRDRDGDGRPILDGDPVAAGRAARQPRRAGAARPLRRRRRHDRQLHRCGRDPGSRRVRSRLRHARQRAPARQLIRTKPAAKRRAFST
jgi:2-keto-4-pentenoate hydratase